MTRAVAVSLALVGLSSLAPAAFADEPMSFDLVQGGSDGREPIWVAAEGEVTSATPDRFQAFVQAHGLQGSAVPVRLHSGGGHLIGGLRLGRLIRQAGLATEVGQTMIVPGQPARRIGGRCASSCAYAFLGGIQRDASHGELGVHRFSYANDKGEAIVKLARIREESRRIIIAILTDYLNDMAVDSSLLTRALSTPVETMHYLSDDELAAFGITGSDATLSFNGAVLRGGVHENVSHTRSGSASVTRQSIEEDVLTDMVMARLRARGVAVE